MGVLAFINHWWNLPFLVMVGLVGVFFLLQLLGLFGDALDGDADADADVDADADAEGDADAGSSWHEGLAFLGVGRVPLMVIWVTLFLFWGFGGLLFNRVLLDVAPSLLGLLFPVNLASTLVVALGAVRVASRLAARFVDVGGNGATTRDQLVGREGVVASARIDSRFGEVRVKDERGEEHLVHGRMGNGEESLARGARVVLVDWDESARLYSLTAFPDTPSLPDR